MLRRFPHRPAHLYRDRAIYFISASTLHRVPLLSEPARREKVLDVYDRVAREAGRPIYAWFIGLDHYHLLLGAGGDRGPLEPLRGALSEGPAKHFDLGRFVNRVHAVVSLLLNRADNTPGRRVFYQYWDRYVRTEGELYGTLNYIHNNPVKHRICANLDLARSYPHSSLGLFHARHGTEWVSECFFRYPVRDFTTFDEDDPE